MRSVESPLLGWMRLIPRSSARSAVMLIRGIAGISRISSVGVVVGFLNADVNAARNIRGRSPDVLPKGRGAVHRKTLYDVLDNHHRVSCGAWLARHTTTGL